MQDHTIQEVEVHSGYKGTQQDSDCTVLNYLYNFQTSSKMRLVLSLLVLLLTALHILGPFSIHINITEPGFVFQLVT